MVHFSPEEHELLESVNRDRLWRDTSFLGAQGRESGSPEAQASVEYIVEELRRIGVDVTVYELDAYLSYHRSAELRVLSPEIRTIPAIARAYTQPTAPEGVELELVVAGEFHGDITNKAVLTARDWPGAYDLRGAGAEIHVQTTAEPNLHRGGGTGVWGTPLPEQAGLLRPQTTGISISRPDGEYLRDLVRRASVRVRIRTEVETGWKRISFPVATIPGKQDTFVLTGGHLDSHDPGVTDNATGCASLLELARILNERRSELRHGLRIGWWTGHESAGYAGSTWYCDNNWDDLHYRCILYWNIDGPGIRDAENIEVRYVFPQVQRFVLDLIHEYYEREPDIIAKPLKMGDQSFWGVGVPSASVYKCLPPNHPDWAVVFGAGHGRWWHSTDDTLDKVDLDNLVDDTRFCALALWRLLTADSLPFEFETYAAWMRFTLTELQEEVGSHFDLGRLLERVTTFERLARSLRAAQLAHIHSAAARGTIDMCLMRLSRHLNPIYFTLVGPYSQDTRAVIPGPPVRYPLPNEPAFEPRYFPGLQRARRLAQVKANPGEYQMLYTAVLREHNRVGHGLDAAIADISATLSILDGSSS